MATPAGLGLRGALVLLLLLGVGYLLAQPPRGVSTANVSSTPNTCPVSEAQTFNEELQAHVAIWDDTDRLASNTARVALSSQVQRLQDLRRDVADIRTYGCMATVRDALVDYMDVRIQQYLAFMAQREVIDGDQVAAAKRQAFVDALDDMVASAR